MSTPIKLCVYGNAVYSNQAALNTELNTINTSTPISIIYTGDNSAVSVWAREWAQSKGIPWCDFGSNLDGAGFVDLVGRPVQLLQLANADQVLTAGSGNDVTAVAAATNAKKKPISQI